MKESKNHFTDYSRKRFDKLQVLSETTHSELGNESLVVLGEFGVGPVETFDLSFEFPEV